MVPGKVVQSLKACTSCAQTGSTIENFNLFSLAIVPSEGVEAPPEDVAAPAGLRKMSAMECTWAQELRSPATASSSELVGKGLIQKMFPPASYMSVVCSAETASVGDQGALNDKSSVPGWIPSGPLIVSGWCWCSSTSG